MFTADAIASWSVGDTEYFFECYHLNDFSALKDEDSSEIDYIVGFTQSLSNGLELEAGVGYIDFAPLFRSENDTLFAYAKLSKIWDMDFGSITAYVAADAYIPTGKDALGGIVGYAGLKCTINLCEDESWTLETDLQGSVHNRFFGYKSGGGVSLDMIVCHSFSDNVSVYVGGIIGYHSQEKSFCEGRIGLQFTW